jgi:hypothetical protein
VAEGIAALAAMTFITTTKETSVPDIFEQITQIAKAHDEKLMQTKHQAVHTGAMDWAQLSPLYTTREDAQGWLDRQLRFSHRNDDSGYIMEIVDAEGSVA